MGEAKRKKVQQGQLAEVFPEARRRELAVVLHKVMGAVTQGYGSDCVMYAQVGAELLRRMGIEAKAVAGVASWRVGPQDGDVITHGSVDPVLTPTLAVQANFKMGAQAGMFHAWIQAGKDIVDFTVVSLGHKARMLDALDGGSTQVDWQPEYLWVDSASVRPPREVAQAPDGGVYHYRHDPRMDAHVLADADPEDVNYLADIVMQALGSGVEVEKLRVVGLGNGVPQDVASAKFRSQAIGLTEVQLGDGAEIYPRERC